MKKIVTLFIISIVANYNISKLLAQVPTAPGSYQWVKGFGSANQITGQDEIVSAMKFDHAGNIIVCGRVAGYSHVQGLGGKKDSILFNRWQNANNLQGFISKYDCNGNLLWFKELEDSINPSEIYDFVVDSSDNIYFFGNSNLGGENIYYDDSLIAPYSFNPPIVGTTILMKINPSGKFNWIWAQPYNVANSIFFQPINQNSNGTVRPNSMVLYHDTINIISPSGSFSSPITINGISIYDGLNLFRFSTAGHLIDAVRLDSINDRLGGYGIDKDGNYLAVINFVYPTNKFLDSTYNRPTASGFNQLSTIIKFNRHHVIRHIEANDSSSFYGADFSNLNNGFNLAASGGYGKSIYGSYILHMVSTFWGSLIGNGTIVHFDDISSYKWTACSDSCYSFGSFSSVTSDANGDVYSRIPFQGFVKYKSLRASTLSNTISDDFVIKLSRQNGNPINRESDFTTTINNSSTNSVRLQNLLVNEKGNIFASGNLSNNSVAVGTDTAKYYGGNNDMFIIKYGNVCGNNMPMIAAGTPGGLVAKCNGTAISLSWQKLNNGEDKYYIYRSFAANSGFVKIDSVQPTINTYTDANVLSKTNYWYAISSHNIVGEGYLSMVDSARLCDDTLSGFVGSVATQYQLSVYPNPCNEKLLVRSNKLLVNTIEVTNVVGRIVFQQINKSLNQQLQIDVSKLSSGIYFIKATDINGNVWNGKFVKE
ncbi:MAG: hypothetical protein RJA07_172 [Bacteroidota bacterium]|jgi:hypothetical protein